MVSEVHEVIRRSLRDCGRALVAKPMVAVLLKQGAPGFNSVESGLYQEMELVAEASLKAGGKDCTLWVVAPRVWPSPLREASSQALVGMEVALNASMAGWLLREECSMWPVQAIVGRASRGWIECGSSREQAEHGASPVEASVSVDGADCGLLEVNR